MLNRIDRVLRRKAMLRLRFDATTNHGISLSLAAPYSRRTSRSGLAPVAGGEPCPVCPGNEHLTRWLPSWNRSKH